jgi:hypothetical protein
MELHQRRPWTPKERTVSIALVLAEKGMRGSQEF